MMAIRFKVFFLILLTKAADFNNTPNLKYSTVLECLGNHTIRECFAQYSQPEDFGNFQNSYLAPQKRKFSEESEQSDLSENSQLIRHGFLTFDNNRKFQKFIVREDYFHKMEFTYDQMNKKHKGKNFGRIKIVSEDLEYMFNDDADFYRSDRNEMEGNNVMELGISGVKKIIASALAIAVVTDTHVRIFGASERPNDPNLDEVLPFNTPVVTAVANLGAFAFILDDGTHRTVFCTGSVLTGGDLPFQVRMLTNVKEIYATEQAFALLTEDGQVHAWGNEYEGGLAADYILWKNVKKIYTTRRAFAAISKDGTPHAWGKKDEGGLLPVELKSEKVVKIVATEEAFAALTAKGQVYAWGNVEQDGMAPFGILWKKIKRIYATQQAFIALSEDGEVFAWGNPDFGGQVPREIGERKVLAIYPMKRAVAALMEDSNIIAWGDENYGGVIDPDAPPDDGKYENSWSNPRTWRWMNIWDVNFHLN